MQGYNISIVKKYFMVGRFELSLFQDHKASRFHELVTATDNNRGLCRCVTESSRLVSYHHKTL